MTIADITAQLEPDLIALRREIHRWPELAGHERRTAALVADRLLSSGLTVSIGVGGYGVVGVLEGAADGPTIAYRADMDAVGAHNRLDFVPSGRVFDREFASEVPDVAHLCGHDLHAAIGVGVAQALSAFRDHMPGRVVFLFQPAEETIQGARAMIDAGVLDRYAPREIYALHCGPGQVGTITVMPGYGLPGLDEFQIELPDPANVQRLTAAVTAMSTVELPRTLEQYLQGFDAIMRSDSSMQRFVFAGCGPEEADGRVLLSGAVKAWPDDRYPQLREQIRTLVESAGGRVEFPAPPFPAMVCSPELSEVAATYLRGAIGSDAVVTARGSWPFAGEDFSLFLQRVPGAMFFLGVANAEAGMNGAPHTPDFAADERAIGFGVRAMAGLLASRLTARAMTPAAATPAAATAASATPASAMAASTTPASTTTASTTTAA